MSKYEELTLHFASCGLYSYEEIGEPYRKEYIDPVLKEKDITIEKFNEDLRKANDKLIKGMEEEMKEKYCDMINSTSIKKISEGQYVLISEKDGSWLVNKPVSHEEAIKRLKLCRKRLELQAKGFSYIPNINLMNGFERHEEMLIKSICGIDVYIVRRKKDVWGIVGHRREIGKDCVCDITINDFTEITDELIDKVVNSVQKIVNDYRKEIHDKISRGEEWC